MAYPGLQLEDVKSQSLGQMAEVPFNRSNLPPSVSQELEKQACTTIPSKRRENKHGKLSRNEIVGEQMSYSHLPCLSPFKSILHKPEAPKQSKQVNPRKTFPLVLGLAPRPPWILQALPLSCSPGCLYKIAHQVTVANFNCNVAGSS